MRDSKTFWCRDHLSSGSGRTCGTDRKEIFSESYRPRACCCSSQLLYMYFQTVTSSLYLAVVSISTHMAIGRFRSPVRWSGLDLNAWRAQRSGVTACMVPIVLSSFLRQSCLVFTNVTNTLEVFLMCAARFTCLLAFPKHFSAALFFLFTQMKIYGTSCVSVDIVNFVKATLSFLLYLL